MLRPADPRFNFYARETVSARLAPSYPDIPTKVAEDSFSEDEDTGLEPYQTSEYQAEITRKLLPPEPQKRPLGTHVHGAMPPPLKLNPTRPPGGCMPTYGPEIDPTPWGPLGAPRPHSDKDPVRVAGLGDFHILPDQVVAKIAVFSIDRKSLLNLTATSRAMYQVANWDTKVWRKLALRRWGGDFTYRWSWKLSTFFSSKNGNCPPKQLIKIHLSQKGNDTTSSNNQNAAKDQQDANNPYAQMHATDQDQNDSIPEYAKNNYASIVAQPDTAQESSQTAPDSDEEFKPIPIKGFFSEPMYMDWYLSQVDLDGWYHDTGHVPRIKAADLTLEQFRESFLKPGLPCIITDVVPTWKAFHTWHPEDLVKQYPETLIKVNEYNLDNLRIKMSFRDFLIYMREQDEAKPLYVFDSSFQRRAPAMLQDFGIPKYFWEDLFAALDESYRPPYRWFLIGSAKTGSPFHTDPNGTSAWNALLHGHKRWALYPPWISHPPGVGFDRKPPDHLRWWTFVYPRLKPEERPIEFIHNPGEMLFIPSGWWHAVLNLDETVSVTQNFVNKENLDAVVHSLHHGSISGLLDYWKQRLLPLRPELYQYITDRQMIETAMETAPKLEQLEAEMEEKEAAWTEQANEMRTEIEALKAKLKEANIDCDSQTTQRNEKNRAQDNKYLALMAKKKSQQRRSANQGY